MVKGTDIGYITIMVIPVTLFALMASLIKTI